MQPSQQYSSDNEYIPKEQIEIAFITFESLASLSQIYSFYLSVSLLIFDNNDKKCIFTVTL